MSEWKCLKCDGLVDGPLAKCPTCEPGAKWTHDPPTEPGWYWYRSTFTMRPDPPRFDDSAPSNPVPVEFCVDSEGVLRLRNKTNGELSRLVTQPNRYSQWWPIPITPPEEK